MSIVATYGFDIVDTNGLDLQWDALTYTWNNFSTAIVPGKPGPGPQGQGAFKWLGNALFTRIFTPQTTWVVGMDWQRGIIAGVPSLCNFLQIGWSGGPVLSIESQPDKTIAVILGGTGANGTGLELARTTGTTFPDAVWNGYLEFECVDFGAACKWAIYVNDVLILSGTTNTGVQTPDRVTIGSQGTDGGRYFDNVYFLNGAGPAPWNARLGPVRITSAYATADFSGTWNPTPINPLGKYPNIADWPVGASPDGSATIITQAFINTTQLFSFSTMPCYGLVLGVMVNVCFQNATCDEMVQITGPPVMIGTNVGRPAFHTFQNFSPTSPATGTFWNDAEINSAGWGVHTTSPFLNVTQIFLEKIVSLRNVPFNCGQGSYGYSGS